MIEDNFIVFMVSFGEGDPKKSQQRQQHLKVLRKKQMADQGGNTSGVEKTHM